MGPDLEIKAKSDALEVPSSKQVANGSFLLEDKVIHQAVGKKFEIERKDIVSVKKPNVSNLSENIEVNVTDGANCGHLFPLEVGDSDLTESSSSFGNTDSENESSAYLSDAEVESQFYVGNTSSSISDLNFETFHLRKKKLTEHWRSFVHPLKWRCKWIELQLKQLNSQALKYEKALLFYDERKRFEFEKFKVDGLDVKSVPFAGQIHRNKIMKRKKRKKVEYMTDSTAYVFNHNIFSYFEKNKSGNTASLVDDSGNRGMASNGKDESDNNMWSLLEFRDSDKPLEDLIAKIEAVHSQVNKLKSRVDEVLIENQGKFASLNKFCFLVPCDESSPSLSYQHLSHGNQVVVRSLHSAVQIVSEFNMENPLATGQQTTSLVQYQPQSGNFWDDTKDGILIHNQVAKEKLHEYENVNEHMEKTWVVMKEPKTVSLAEISGVNLVAENLEPDVQASVNSQSPPKSILVTNSGRAKRKSATKNWRNRYSD